MGSNVLEGEHELPIQKGPNTLTTGIKRKKGAEYMEDGKDENTSKTSRMYGGDQRDNIRDKKTGRMYGRRRG
jgi:hypothetical protein